MSNYSFRAHAASDHRKWIAVTLAILLIIAVIVTGVLTDWFSNWNKYCLFGHNYGEDGLCVRCGEAKAGGEVEKVEPVVDDNGGMQSAQAANNGIRLMSAAIPREQFGDYGIMSIAESAQQLTATIDPSDATNKAVDWSIAWKNPSSAFASGKTVTDYVTVTPTEDGALTANVQCLQAFGEQIEIKVTSRDDNSKFATCNVDYKKRVSGVETTISIAGQPGKLILKADGTVEGNGMPFGNMYVSGPPTTSSGSITYTIGTIDNSAVPSLSIQFPTMANGYMATIRCNMGQEACQRGSCGHIVRSFKDTATYSDLKDFKPTLDILNHLCTFNSGKTVDSTWGRSCFSKDYKFNITISCDGWSKTYSNLGFDQSIFTVSVQSVGGLTDLVF